MADRRQAKKSAEPKSGHKSSSSKMDTVKKTKQAAAPKGPAPFNRTTTYNWRVTFLGYKPVGSAPYDYCHFRHGSLFFVPYVNNTAVPGGSVLAHMRGWVGHYTFQSIPNARDYQESSNYVFAQMATGITEGHTQDQLIAFLQRIPPKNHDMTWTCQNWVKDVIAAMIAAGWFWNNSTQNRLVKAHLKAWHQKIKTAHQPGQPAPKITLTEAEKKTVARSGMMMTTDEAVGVPILNQWIAAKEAQSQALMTWCDQ